MSLSVLSGVLQTAPQYKQLQRDLERPRVGATAQVLDNAVPFTLATLHRDLGYPILVLTPRPEDARRLHEQLLVWSDDEDQVLHFPESEILPFERLSSDSDTVHQRLRTLSRLVANDGPAPIVVASVAAVTQKTIDKKSFVVTSHTLARGRQIDLDDLLGQWLKMGYQFESSVYGPGFVSRRGGIVDIFPLGAEMPARIELWGNEIDSIRLFDPSTQRSTDVVESIDVTVAQETLPALTSNDDLERSMAYLDVSNCSQATQERLREEFDFLAGGHEVEDLNFYAGFFSRGSLLDYVPDDALVIRYRPPDIAEAAWDIEERTHDLREAKEGRGELPRNFPSSHLLWHEVEERLTRVHRRLDVTPWGAQELTQQDAHVLPFTSPPTFFGKLDSFVDEARELMEANGRVVTVTSHSRRLGEIFSESKVKVELPDEMVEVPKAGSFTLVQSEAGGLNEGFILTSQGERLAVFSDTEVFGITKQRRTRRRASAMRDAFLSELSPGDYVVHVEHGIGRFVGTGHLAKEEGGDSTEYLILQYAQSDKLYVPMEHLDRVAGYVAPLDRPPSLTRLGTQEWKRAKERAERSTREMAAELLALYAARELVDGYAFSPDVPWQAEVEESFPFEETPDQLATIAEVKADMESKKPMDRLVCGDVGYGKTEIALRAAFKAVMEGKQVAVLVPTTVLAQQHYVTFSQRLSAYPIRIEVLSRFRTDKEQRSIVEGLATGQIDICIGTHRLIQRDVRFKNLGLVVIDEEQRFGVAHKERLKQMRQEVDILTLTATPIPRTLHMSMAGVRDMSTMETPPEERLPIKTYVSEFSDELIREAILRELDRQGQVYFLHNRVHNIDYMAGYIRNLVPEAEVGVAHGQMHEGELEQAMLDFAERKMDVLVCTTIIESGLDIQNVNTLIVNRADAFGLSQLYQLRGRVGRSARRAYSYLLIPKTRSLTDTAEKRLKAMLAATELGAGFRIAMKDLEIRGAGNILGSEQSGHIHAVGFELYTKLLSTAVQDLKASREGSVGAETSTPPEALDGTGPEPEAIDPTIDVGIPASLPEDYIDDLSTRLGMYQRMVQLRKIEDVDEMADELRDRFGPLPWQSENLLYVTKLKIHARNAGLDAVSRQGGKIVLRTRYDVGGARRALQRRLGSHVEVGNKQIRILLDEIEGEWEAVLLDTTEKLSGFVEQMSSAVPVA